MKRFAALYDALDFTPSTRVKVASLVAYLRQAPPEDAAWAVFFLTGRRIKRLLSAPALAAWAMERAQIPGWLFGECVGAVGDLAETLTLIQDPGGEVEELSLSRWMEERILPLRRIDDAGQREQVVHWWQSTPASEQLVLNKLLTGEFRVGASATLVKRALAEVAGVPPQEIDQRMMGLWEPTAEGMRELLAAAGAHAHPRSRPYPFYLASPLESGARPPPEWRPEEWLAEWKWDGIRAQLIRRGGETFIWTRGEELITQRFPEIASVGAQLPEGTVIDGEILAFRGEGPLPFSVLQKRIGRQRLTEAILCEAPTALMAFDLLEWEGRDLRSRPLTERRTLLEAAVQDRRPSLQLSAEVPGDWDQRALRREEARARGVEGLMLKLRAGPYRNGRPRGEWWKWKIVPYTLDAVLTYAQPGSGKRASLYTDLTFGVWDRGQLVTIAKAYSGLSDEEIAQLDRWIREHTIEKRGPVRVVEPVHVFELAFEGIAASPRHKAGIAVRFPRIARWRTDKRPADADTLESLQRLLLSRTSS